MKNLLITILSFACFSAWSQDTIVIALKDTSIIVTPAPQKVATPTFNPGASEIDPGETIQFLCATVGANMYYTLTGVDPTTSSTLYTAPISISTACTVKVLATKPGMTNSNIASAAYTIAPPDDGSPDFPRLWWHSTSNPKAYDDALLKLRMAYYDGITLGAVPGATINGKTLATIVNQFHSNALKSTGTKVFQYIVLNEATHPLDAGYPNTPYQWFNNRIESSNAWYYIKGTSGLRATSTWPGKTLINQDPSYTPVIAGIGKNILDWGVVALVELFKNGNGPAYGAPNMAATNLDGFSVDNIFPYTKKQVDYDRNGTTDAQDNATLSSGYRLGQKRIFTILDSIDPDGIHIGNSSSWRNLGAPKQHVDQAMGGGLIEGQYGSDWSPLTTAAMMASYKNQMDMFKAPKLGVFTGYVSPDTTVQMNRDRERYLMSACAMGDGYLCITNGDLSYNQTPRWLPEFMFNLGQAVDNPVYTPNYRDNTTALIGYKREFDNGIAIMNPVGAGTRTYLLLGTYYKLAGWTADYTVSGGDGTGITSITLRDGSGIFLSKTPTN